MSCNNGCGGQQIPVSLNVTCSDMCRCVSIISPDDSILVTKSICQWTLQAKAQPKPAKKQFIATADQSTYISSSLTGATFIEVFIEGMLKWEGDGPEDYTFDSGSGIVTFNTPLYEGQRIIIIYFK